MKIAQDAPWSDIVGADVAKGWIDLHWLGCGHSQRLKATRQALGCFAARAKGCLVVCEPSGGCERPLVAALAKAGVACSCPNAARARAFAQAQGRLAKTDKADARSLAEMGQALRLRPDPPADPDRARLADLVARRDDLVAMIGAERCRLAQARAAELRQEVASLVRVLLRHLARINEQIAALVDARAALAKASRCLQSVPGIGPAIAAVLLARLPELGQLPRRQVAALAGLAPHPQDSGLHKGKRRIRGGRAAVRRALYLAAFVASRHDPTFKAFRARLQAAGKPTKLALTACARKLLTTLNAMMRTGQTYAPAPN